MLSLVSVLKIRGLQISARSMRLLHSIEPLFTDFAESLIPAYAILSHRWENTEVSFQELQQVLNPDTRLDELLGRRTLSLDDDNYAKIQACRAMAAAQGFQWVWIDTCCINKDSSAELSEAINSMYRWYQAAAVCFVYLSDVCAINPQIDRQEEKYCLRSISESQWFTRGWTLQELLAPKNKVLFYDVKWEYLGDRTNLAEPISERTRIDVEYLRCDSKCPLPILTACGQKNELGCMQEDEQTRRHGLLSPRPLQRQHATSLWRRGKGLSQAAARDPQEE